MIAPYLSIDLFFVAAPFLCQDEQELAVFCKRIVSAIGIAGVCFLLFPLRFAFERPHASGWLGAAFDWFRGMDLPYNLLPSLHLAFRTILAELYARHTHGLWRRAAIFWFFPGWYIDSSYLSTSLSRCCYRLCPWRLLRLLHP
jgi:hypothetical protein